MMSPAVEVKIATLLEVLDEDIRHLEGALSRLDALRSLLVKRDDVALAGLLGDIRQQADAHRANEQKRQQFRKELAADLGCAEGDLTLSKLRGELAGPTGPETQRRCGAALADRQIRLRSLAAQLKREYTLTVLLLRDCTRFNRSVLQVFLGSGGRGGAIYNSTGVAKRPTNAALMNMKL